MNDIQTQKRAKQTNKQNKLTKRTKQINQQINTQANRQTDRQSTKQTNKQTHTHTNTHASSPRDVHRRDLTVCGGLRGPQQRRFHRAPANTGLVIGCLFVVVCIFFYSLTAI